MSMYETRGFCPDTSFLVMANNKNSHQNCKYTINILGNRIECMVYTKSGNHYPDCYIVDALMNTQELLGIEVACCLREMTPFCSGDESDKVIWLTDIINPYQIPVPIYNKGNDFHLINDSDAHQFKIFQDEKFFVCITQENDDSLHIYCFKKCVKGKC